MDISFIPDQIKSLEITSTIPLRKILFTVQFMVHCTLYSSWYTVNCTVHGSLYSSWYTVHCTVHGTL